MTANADALPDPAAIPANALVRDTGLTLAATLTTAAMPPRAGIAPAPTVNAPVGSALPSAGGIDPAPTTDPEPPECPNTPTSKPSTSPKAPIADGKTANRPTAVTFVDPPKPEPDTSPASPTGADSAAQDPANKRKAVVGDRPAADASECAAIDAKDRASAVSPLDTIAPITPTPPVSALQPGAQQIVAQGSTSESAANHPDAPAPVGGTAATRTQGSVDAAAPPESATDSGTPDPASPVPPHKPQESPTPPPPAADPQAASPVPAAGPATAPVAPPAQPATAQPSTPPPLPAPRRPVDAGIARAASIGRDVGVAITRHASRDGASTLTIRLDPVELGRVDVRMQIDSAGKVLATISAEHTTALELLRRDAAMLAQTLSQAGVQADAASFRFDPQPGQGNGAGNTGSGNAGGGHADRGGWAFAAPSRHPGDDANAPRNAPAPTRPAGLASGRINLVA